MHRSILFLIALVGVAAMSAAESAHREKIEWCNIRWENTTDPKLPRVLLIGDSITLGYSGHVKKLLAGKANVDVLATSKGIDDPAFLKETAYALEGYAHAVVHFNNGLHGWHVNNEAYAECVRAYVKELQRLAPNAKLVWASTTPVPSRRRGAKLDKKRNGIVLARNKAARQAMDELGIPINDLYGLMVGDLEQLTASKGNVHYGEKGKAMQGQAVADAIAAQLGE